MGLILPTRWPFLSKNQQLARISDGLDLSQGAIRRTMLVTLFVLAMLHAIKETATILRGKLV